MKLRIWSHLLNESLKEKFIFCAVRHLRDLLTNSSWGNAGRRVKKWTKIFFLLRKIEAVTSMFPIKKLFSKISWNFVKAGLLSNFTIKWIHWSCFFYYFYKIFQSSPLTLKAGLFEGSFFCPLPPCIFQEELILYQYRFIQLLNNLLKVRWKWKNGDVICNNLMSLVSL